MRTLLASTDGSPRVPTMQINPEHSVPIAFANISPHHFIQFHSLAISVIVIKIRSFVCPLFIHLFSSHTVGCSLICIFYYPHLMITYASLQFNRFAFRQS